MAWGMALRQMEAPAEPAIPGALASTEERVGRQKYPGRRKARIWLSLSLALSQQEAKQGAEKTARWR